MGAREELRWLVEDLSEEDALTWLGRMRAALSGPESYDDARRRHPVARRTDRQAALRCLEELKDEPEVLSEGAWEVFALALDEQRPERRLFA